MHAAISLVGLLLGASALSAIAVTNDPACNTAVGGIASYGRYTKVKAPMAKPLRGSVGCVDKDVVQKRTDYQNAKPQEDTVKVQIYGPMEAGNDCTEYSSVSVCCFCPDPRNSLRTWMLIQALPV